MKAHQIALAAGVLVLLALGSALAANTDNQTVTLQVTAINEIAVSGDPAALIVNTATAGAQPDTATDNSTDYDITTNESNKRITGAVDVAVPANTELYIFLVAPTGAASAGDVQLTTTAADLVTGITTLAESNNTITYKYYASIAAGIVASTTRTVTLTLTDP
ncbi:MAG: hypothetical protein PVF95_04980 [bacterium]|jgi:hypothetical protein